MFDQKYITRFWAAVDRRGPDECWLWLRASRNSAGYGVFTVGKRLFVASRFALILATGQLPPPKVLALHSCDNPPCCNPRHLRWGNHKANAADAIGRVRHVMPPIVRHNPDWEAKRLSRMQHGEQRSQAKLTDAIVATIYQMRLAGYRATDVAAHLGLGLPVVKDAYVGRSWKHCLGKNGNPTLEQLRAA